MTPANAAPYALLLLTWLGEGATALNARRGAAVRRDGGTLAIFSVGMIGCYVLAFVWAHRFPAFGLGAWATPAGLATGGTGIALRVWAIRTLGQWFTRTVQVSADQPVIQHGPYAWMRHPSYTAIALQAIGLGLTLRSLVSLSLVLAPTVVVGVLRVRVEEAALVETLGEPYRDYMRRVKRFIPGIL